MGGTRRPVGPVPARHGPGRRPGRRGRDLGHGRPGPAGGVPPAGPAAIPAGAPRTAAPDRRAYRPGRRRGRRVRGPAPLPARRSAAGRQPGGQPPPRPAARQPAGRGPGRGPGGDDRRVRRFRPGLGGQPGPGRARRGGAGHRVPAGQRPGRAGGAGRPAALVRARRRRPAVLPHRRDDARGPLRQLRHPRHRPDSAHRAAAGHAGGGILAAARPAGVRRDQRPAPARVPADRGGHLAGRAAAGTRPDARLALRLWRLDRKATRSALRALGVPVLSWGAGTELDSVLAPLRQPPPGARRAALTPAARP